MAKMVAPTLLVPDPMAPFSLSLPLRFSSLPSRLMSCIRRAVVARGRVTALNGSVGAVQIFPQLGVKRPRLSRPRIAQSDPLRGGQVGLVYFVPVVARALVVGHVADRYDATV
jgi:hypothetical protein